MRADPTNAADRRVPSASANRRSNPPAPKLQTATDVWTRYRSNAARHLIGIARDLQNRSLNRLTEERGYRDLRPSLSPLLSLIALEARPLGALATQLSISPQACSQLVNIAEAAGYVARQPAPTDRRTRVIALTKVGCALVVDADEILASIEAEYRRLVPKKVFDRFADALQELFEALDLPAATNHGLIPTKELAIGTLPLISVHVQRELMASTARAGHAGLKMSHAQVLPLIGPDGARVGALARIQRVSRQAISTTAKDLEGLGVLRREADPRDLRGVVFRLTASGERLIKDSVDALDTLDRSIIDAIGIRRLSSLQAGARALYEALHLEDEVFAGHQHTVQGTRGPQLGGAELSDLANRLRRELGKTRTKDLAALLSQRV